MGSKASDAGQQRVQVLSEVQNSDLTAARNEFIFPTPVLSPWLKTKLRDQRDEPMVHLIINICTYLSVWLPLMYGLALADTPRARWWCHFFGLFNTVVHYAGFLPRFLLMMHYASHRTAFQPEWGNVLLGWVLPPFFGVPCGVYKLHHCIMHHIENNHGMDISATDFYQRDSLKHFICYWLRFTFLIWVELPVYTVKTSRWQWMRTVTTGLTVWVGVILLLCRVSTLATTYVLIVPYFTSMLAMSFGNWGQHMFVDPDNFKSNYALTYNCIDAPANRKTFNDGYHIVHHLNGRVHWSEMPQNFYDNVEQYKEQGAITFRTLDFFEVGLFVMSGNLRRLAEKYYVHIGPKETAPTVDEMVEKFKSWLKPVPQDAASAAAAAERAKEARTQKKVE
jgi:fatty acid desaturase